MTYKPTFEEIVQNGRKVECNAVQIKAYSCADWGKLRKRNYGSPSHRVGLRHWTQGSGFRMISEHYADYVCSVYQNWVAYSWDGQQHVGRQWRGRFFVVIDGVKVLHRTLAAIKQYHTPVRSTSPRSGVAVNQSLRDAMKRLRHAGFDAKLVRQPRAYVVAGSGDNIRPMFRGKPAKEYTKAQLKATSVELVVNLGGDDWYHCCTDVTPDHIRGIIKRRKVAERQARIDEFLKTNARQVWVSIEDSLAAGNCSPGTEAFVANYLAKINAVGAVGAVRADQLLSIKDDSFTRRACNVAALRYCAQ